MITFDVTYELINEEESEIGDTDRRGFIAESIRLREAIQEVYSGGNMLGYVSNIEPNCSDIQYCRWITLNYGMDEYGDYESRSVHIPNNVTVSSIKRILRLIHRGV